MQINKTLLTKLFLDPSPQPKDKEVIIYYTELYNRMFPNPDDYIEFLGAQGIDRQYESAERIVHRLCYHANFPPSYYALLDIICVENCQKKKTQDSDTYIPRDHFIHIVYLYLLGIYMFFYNSEFFSKIIYENRFERNGLSVGNAKRDCIKDFISEWKYFCLYHDIGYSAEILGNTEKFPKSKRARFQAELRRSPGGYKASLGKNAILKQHAFFGTLEVISKILFIKLVISNSTEKIFPEHKIYRNFRNRKLILRGTDTSKPRDIKFEEIPETYLTGLQLEKIYSNHCLKKLLPIVNSNDISIIGLDKNYGYVGFITYVENETRFFVYLSEVEMNDELRHLLKSPEIVLFDDYVSNAYEFIYVLRNPDIEEHISSVVNIDYFHTVYAQAESLFENDYKGIADEAHFVDFSYTVYHWLFSKIRSRLDNSNLEKYLEQQKFSFSESDNPEELRNLLERNRLVYEILKSLNEYHVTMLHKTNELLREQIESKLMKADNVISSDKMISDFINQYFGILSDIAKAKSIKAAFSSAIKMEMLSQIESEVDLLQLFSEVYVRLKCTLDKSDVGFEYNYATGDTRVPQFLNDCIQSKIREKMSMSNLETVQNEYTLKHGNTVDHGILSAEYAAGVFSCYRNALMTANNVQEKILLSILLDIPNEIEKSRVRYIDNYDHVFTNVLFAVFVHNLYPDSFEKKSKGGAYRTKMSDPFTYLALLCDALQQWNRPRAIHPALFENRPLGGVSEEYNVDTKDNHIFISDKDIDYGRGLIATLGSYMANIKAYLSYKP